MFSTTLLLALALATGPGCTYIGPDYERQLKELLVDSDGDGEVDTTDCNDSNPNVNRNMVEIPYDGLDNDCSGGDLLDVDGDGYAGISLADWEAQDLDTDNVTWNFNLPGDLVDCADDPETEPLASAIYPNNSNEKPYDGVDSNCDQENDFDLDDDGVMPDEYPAAAGGYESTQPAFEAFVARWGYEFNAEYGDCDDSNRAIKPGATPDVWYDGVDTDCSGNNDFDQDGDGYIPEFVTVDGEEVDVLSGAYQTFLDRFHNSTAPSDWFVNDAPNPDDEEWKNSFDCVDDPCDLRLGLQDDCSGDPIMQAEVVYPGAPDTWYDGVDSDCQRDNDFDQDGDLSMAEIVSVTTGDGSVDVRVDIRYPQFVDAWDYDFPEHSPNPIWGDCDDNDPTRSPLNVEVLGDDNDQDCEGGTAEPDKAGIGMSDYTWTRPRSPQLGWNGQHIALSVMADQLYVDDSLLTDEAGMLFFFDPTTAQNTTMPAKELNWHGFGSAETQHLGDGLDMYIDQYGATWLSYTYQRWSTADGFDGCDLNPSLPSCYTYLTAQEVEYNAEKGAYVSTRYYSTTHNSFYRSTDIDLLVDNNGPWAVACGVAGKDIGGDSPTLVDMPVVKTLRGVGVDDTRADDLVDMNEVFPRASVETTSPIPQACFFAQSGLPTGNQAEFSVCNEITCATHSFNGTSSEITNSDGVDTWFPSLLSESNEIYVIDRDGLGDGGSNVELYTTISSIEGQDYLAVFNEANEMLASFVGDHFEAGAATQIGDVLYMATIPGHRSSDVPALWYGSIVDDSVFSETATSIPLSHGDLTGNFSDVAILATSTADGTQTLALALTSGADEEASEGQVAWSFWQLM
jgi:hypothetical protein